MATRHWVTAGLVTLFAALFAVPVASASAAPRIVGGSQANIKAFPFQVSIYDPYADSILDGHYCGGVIIDSTHVATAAHCIFDTFEYGQATRPGDLRVLAGTGHLNDSNDPAYGSDVKLATVAKSSFSPNLDLFTADYDAAVLTLAQPLYTGSPTPDGNTKIAPVPLIDATQAATWANPSLQSPATVSGWGVTDSVDFETPADLRSVKLKLVPDATCAEQYTHADFPAPITPRMLCATDPGEGSCYGDSGGPLVVDGASPAQTPDDYLLAGLVSWGGDECADPDFPDVYTRIADPGIRNFLLSNPPQAPNLDTETTLTGTAKVGQTVTCNPGSWSGSPTFTYQFAAFTEDDFVILTPPSGQNTYTLQAAEKGAEIFCEVKATNAGGYGYGGSDSLIVGSSAAGTPPPTTIAGSKDTASPQVGVISESCKRRRCKLKLSVFDPPPSAGVRSVSAKLTGRKRVRCGGKRKRTCSRRTNKRLNAVRLGGGLFRVETGKLAAGAYKLTLSATDNAGNRQATPTRVQLQVKRR